MSYFPQYELKKIELLQKLNELADVEALQFLTLLLSDELKLKKNEGPKTINLRATEANKVA